MLCVYGLDYASAREIGIIVLNNETEEVCGYKKREANASLVKVMGLEPTHPFGYQFGKLARLPFPPYVCKITNFF